MDDILTSFRHPLFFSYEFVFNVCQQLVYADGDCIYGSGACERLSETKTAMDVYGTYQSAIWAIDTSETYFPDNLNAPYVGTTIDTPFLFS